MRKKFKKKMLDVADWIGHFETEEAIEGKKELIALLNDESKAKEFYDLLAYTFPMMADLSFINLTLYYCAIITVEHISLSRYPENGKNPDVIYTRRLPLVQKQNQFMDLLGESLQLLKNINRL